MTAAPAEVHVPAALPAMLRAAQPTAAYEVTRIVGLGVEVGGLRQGRPSDGFSAEGAEALSSAFSVPVGAVVEIGTARTPAEVVAAEGDRLRCMPLSGLHGVAVGMRSTLRGPVPGAGRRRAHRQGHRRAGSPARR